MKKKKVLITGITGQDGSYLSKLLLNKNYIVYGLNRRSSNNLENLNKLGIKNEINMVNGDMLEFSSIQNVINNINPDMIFNLAAQSFVGSSFTLPIYTSQVNYISVIYFLESILNTNKKIKFYQASTSEIFGNSTKSINENSKKDPISPYGISKLASYHLVKYYRNAYNLFSVNGILFNHESPLRGHDFVTRKITNGLAKIKFGLIDKIEVGNIYSVRDWGHAKDYVYAMYKIMTQKKPDDFVVGTGKSYTVKYFIERCAKYLDIPLIWEKKGDKIFGKNKLTNKVIIESIKVNYRPTDIDYLNADIKKIKKNINWSPKISLNELIKEMCDEDLKNNA